MSRAIIIIICLSLLLIFAIGAVFSKYQELNLLQLGIKNKNAELQYETEYFSKLSDVSKNLEKYKENLAKINSALPNNPGVPDLLNFLQKTSSQTGLVLKKIGPPSTASSKEKCAGEKNWNPEIQETAFNIAVAGSYSAFKNFLSILEKSSRMIDIESISFSASQEEISFTFNLRLKTYSY